MNIDETVRAVAAFDLSSQSPSPVRDLQGAEDTWVDLLHVVRQERLEGPFVTMIAKGGLHVATWQREEAERAHVEAMALAVRIDAVVRRIAEVFGAADVPMRVLKGPASAHLDHPDPALRSYGDADILVPSRSYEKACQLLRRAGFERRSPQLAPGFDKRFAKSVTFVSRDGLEVDLHRTLVYGPFSVGITEADLWRPGPSIDLGGASVEALEINRRFVHACVHSALGSPSPRLMSLRDIVVIGFGAVDPDEVASIATRWRIEPALMRAVSLVRSHLGIDLDWLREMPPASTRDFRLRCSLDEHSQWASSTVGLFVTLPSWSDRAGLARMLSASLRTPRERSVGSRVRSFVRAGWRSAGAPALARSSKEFS